MLVHGAIALIVVAPIVWHSRHRVAYAALAVAVGSVLDIDHFVAAGSTSLHAIETLGGRPATHSLAFIALLAVAALALTRRAPLAWSLFAVNAAHVMFDAAGGHEQPLYPLGGQDGLPWLLCPVSIALLVLASALLARQRAGVAVRRRSVSRCEPVSGWADARLPLARV